MSGIEVNYIRTDHNYIFEMDDESITCIRKELIDYFGTLKSMLEGEKDLNGLKILFSSKTRRKHAEKNARHHHPTEKKTDERREIWTYKVLKRAQYAYPMCPRKISF